MSYVATSMFATYIGRGELIVYPFFEHYRDGNRRRTGLRFRPGSPNRASGMSKAKCEVTLLLKGLTGRASLSAFFLEDLLAPIENVDGAPT